MLRALEIETTVLPGHRIEVYAPELPEGHAARVLIVLDEKPVQKRPFRQVLGEYPGKQLFQSGEEVEAYLRAERDSWDR